MVVGNEPSTLSHEKVRSRNRSGERGSKHRSVAAKGGGCGGWWIVGGASGSVRTTQSPDSGEGSSLSANHQSPKHFQSPFTAASKHFLCKRSLTSITQIAR